MTREEAIAYLNGLIREDYKEQTEALNMAIKALEQQKMGHWVKEYIGCIYDVCSECGQKITTGYFEYEYCPNCGAKMEVEE